VHETAFEVPTTYFPTNRDMPSYNPKLDQIRDLEFLGILSIGFVPQKELLYQLKVF